MENTKTCETCKHFIQHYYKFGQTFRPLSVGHCTDPRCRDKKVETPACPVSYTHLTLPTT